MAAHMRIGIDLGGTKIEAVAMNHRGEILSRLRVATPAGDYPAILAAVQELVKSLEREQGRRAVVGVATPGAVSPATGYIKNSNTQCLNGKPLREDLAGCLQRAVRLANDADCLALSEAVDGAAAGARTVFGVILGTGTGGGIVIEGRLQAGPNAIAGEWGHNPLPWARPDELPGPPCYCGKTGCIETFLSGPGMARDHREATGQDLSPREIAAAAGTGEPLARQTLHRYGDRLARGLAGVINILDPDIIVLAGGLSQISLLYELVPTLWGEYVFSDRVDTRLVPAGYGAASGVRGAAWLWSSEDPG